MSIRHYYWNRGEPWNSIRSQLAPQILRALHSMLLFFVRVSSSGIGQGRAFLEGQNEGAGAIFVVWHDVMLFPMYLFRHRNVGVIVSPSRSGQVAAALWRLHGWPTTWGSTKGQQGVPALRKGISQLRSGQSMGFTPDGPLGPRHVAQPGVVYLAAMSSAPIFPLGVAISRSWHLPTWDRHAVPQPFCRAHLHLGKPLLVPKDGRREAEEWRLKIQNAMRASTQEAARRLIPQSK